jgi:putative transposase
MLKAIRAGMSMREAAVEFGFRKSTVAFWAKRARGKRLDRVRLANRKPGRAWNRTPVAIEQRIAELRRELRDSVLGEYGARTIYSALAVDTQQPPSEAAINRVLSRLGLQDGVRRIRRPAPPKGWYLPAVVAGRAELDCFDFIEELKIADGPLVDVLTTKSLHGSLTDAWVLERKSTKATIPCLLQRWQRDGLPTYAQFDNAHVFQGAHHFANAVGAISRLCLQLGVTPIFVPPLEYGMQNSIESFNALWQAKVWQRHHVSGVSDLQTRSDQYIAAHRARTQPLAEAAPRRRPMRKNFKFNPHMPLRGHIIFIRRTDESGCVNMLGQTFNVSAQWLHRLVRCEISFNHRRIDCFALRRRAPADQPLLITIPYHRLDKPFEGKL